MDAWCMVYAEPEDEDSGYVVGQGIRQLGSFARLEAIPAEGYEFDGWYENGVLITGDDVQETVYRFRVQEERKITARFAALPIGGGGYFQAPMKNAINGQDDVDTMFKVLTLSPPTVEIHYFGSRAIPFDTSGALTIPRTVQYQGVKYTIKGIGRHSFNHCWDLTSVEIPDTIEYIGEGAFYACGMSAVNIPSSVVTLDQEAFAYCRNLTSVTIPGSINDIGNYAFQDCGLETVTMESGVQAIGTSAFYRCRELTSVAIPDTVTSIGSAAFNNCNTLPEIEIPDSVMSMGDGVFAGCYELATVKLSNNLTSIGNLQFIGCYKLESIDIPASVTSIGSDAFRSCNSLQSVTLRSATPPEVYSVRGVFTFVPISEEDMNWNEDVAVLNIPFGATGAYQAAGWNIFKRIVELDFDVAAPKIEPSAVLPMQGFSQPFSVSQTLDVIPYITINDMEGDTYYSLDSGDTWELYMQGELIPVEDHGEVWAYNALNEIDGMVAQNTYIKPETPSVPQGKLGAFGAGFLTAMYENPQQWANVLPFLYSNTELTADTNNKKDLLELIDNSCFVGVQEMGVDGNTWKNYDQLAGSVFSDNFNGAYVGGVVNDLKNNPNLTNAATSGAVTIIDGAWDNSTVNPTGAASAQKLKITGGNSTLNGDYPALTEVRVESYGGTQLLGNYPNLEYIYMTSWANLNLAGNFPSLRGVYMPGGQLLLGTAALGFKASGADIINESGNITVCTAQDTELINSNIVTNAKIAIRGAGTQSAASQFNADGAFFGAGNALTLGGLHDDNTENFAQVPVFFAHSVSIVNCDMELLQGSFTSRDGTMVFSGSDIDVFRGFLFAPQGIDGNQTTAKEGVYIEGSAFNVSSGLSNENYQPNGGTLGTISALQCAPVPEKFGMIQNGTAFLGAVKTADRYTLGSDS